MKKFTALTCVRNNIMKRLLLGLFILSAVLTATEAWAVKITIDGYNCTCGVDRTTISVYTDSSRGTKIGEKAVLSGQSSEFYTNACPGCVEVKIDAWGMTSYYYYYFKSCKNIRVTLKNNNTCTDCNSNAVEEQ